MVAPSVGGAGRVAAPSPGGRQDWWRREECVAGIAAERSKSSDRALLAVLREAAESAQHATRREVLVRVSSFRGRAADNGVGAPVDLSTGAGAPASGADGAAPIRLMSSPSPSAPASPAGSGEPSSSVAEADNEACSSFKCASLCHGTRGAR